jgi:hypothetical protein
MATGIQVVFDCADPNGLARFWAEALGYRLQDPPEAHTSSTTMPLAAPP